MVALGIQLLILLPWAVEQYRLNRPGPVASDTANASFASLLASMDSTERNRLLTRFDSAGIAVDYRGDSIASVTISPEFRAEMDSAVSGIVSGVSEAASILAPLFVIVVAVAFAPTLVATGLTLAWLLARRQRRGESRVADV